MRPRSLTLVLLALLAYLPSFPAPAEAAREDLLAALARAQASESSPARVIEEIAVGVGALGLIGLAAFVWVRRQAKRKERDQTRGTGQRAAAILVAIVAFVLAGTWLVPPWKEVGYLGIQQRSLGYGLLFSPPDSWNGIARVDVHTLLVQSGVVVLLGIGVAALLSRRD